MKKILGIIKISRPVNFIITFLVVLTSAFICSEEIFELNKIIFASLSASFIAGAGNIINDIFDYRIDLITPTLGVVLTEEKCVAETPGQEFRQRRWSTDLGRNRLR